MRTLRLPVVVILFALLGLLSPLMARYIREIITAAGAEALSGVVPDPVVGDAVIQFTKNLGSSGCSQQCSSRWAPWPRRRSVARPLSCSPSRSAAAHSWVARPSASARFWLWRRWWRVSFAGSTRPSCSSRWRSAGSRQRSSWSGCRCRSSPRSVLASVVARSALVAGGIGIAALLATGILSALPVVGPYLPTSLWGLADQLAIGSVPDQLLGPVLANVTVVVVLVAASSAAFARQEL